MSEQTKTCRNCGRFHFLSRADKSMLAQALRPSTDMDENWESMSRLAPFGLCEAACCDENGWQDVIMSVYWKSSPCRVEEDWVPREGRDDEV